MRLSRSIVLLALSVGIHASAVPKNAQPATLEQDVLEEGKSQPIADAGETPENAEGSTIFNSVRVPPMKELKGESLGEDIADGHWFVKFYSPYCAHCIKIAPLWQTLYEYYYVSEGDIALGFGVALISYQTSKPNYATKISDPKNSPSVFHGFYNFHFGSLDCASWGDACTDRDVTGYPTFIMFKNGVELKRYKGEKSMEDLSGLIEETLESIKPGSRLSGGVKLPEAGATSSKDWDEESVAKAKDSSKSIESKEKAEAEESKTPAPSSTRSRVEAKLSAPPNPAGTSIELTPESFLKLVTATQDPWFIKFYAPWCPHCQQMAANWEQMARELQGKLNVGEVNCEAHKRLCKDVQVKAYPTMYFFRGGERVEYNGLRGFGDLLTYARKALDVCTGVTYVDALSLKEMEQTEEVIFIYFYDKATTEEDFDALDRLTLSLIGHAKLVKTDSKVLADRFKIHSWPRLLVTRDGRPSYYTALAPKDMRDFRLVLNWMQTVWSPIVPELTVLNSREIMNGRFVVLGVLSRDRPDEFILDKREIKNAALEWMDKETQNFQAERKERRRSKQLRIDEAEDRNDQRALRAAKSMRITITEQDSKQVGFAWVDGVYWERWLRTTYGVDIKDGHKVIIVDDDNKRYWDVTVTGNPILPLRTSILDTLPKIVADPPLIAAKYTTNKIEQMYFLTKAAIREHPWISLILIGGGITAAFTFGKRRLRRARRGSGGFFHLDGKERVLGNGTTGKVD